MYLECSFSSKPETQAFLSFCLSPKLFSSDCQTRLVPPPGSMACCSSPTHQISGKKGQESWINFTLISKLDS